jgi:hypothetical protein
LKTVIIGGGLAGMAAALELARYGIDVEILEASERLGGKAGADRDGTRYQEHGYHIFPAWYVNVRKILTELGIQLTDEQKYHFLRAGAFPDFATVEFNNPLSGKGLVPLPDRLLIFYFLVDMFGESLDHKRFLDRISALGLLRSKWYATDEMAKFNQENLLKAVAVPAYELSGYTSRLVGINFASNPTPFMSLLRGNLQTTWIEPFGARLRGMGVDVKLGRKVTKIAMSGGRVAQIEAVDASTGARSVHTGDHYLWATNLEVLRDKANGFLDDALYQADPQLGRVHQLHSAPMTALHLYLNVKLAGMPREHVFLSGGKYALSFIDVSQHWPDLPNTALSFIASDFLSLQALSESAQKAALLEEIMAYLPISAAQIDQVFLQPNVTTPLFMNTITAWGDRPEPRTKVPNLRIAGDYVKSHIDLATMEGAVSTAQAAAASILDDHGVPHLPMPAQPKQIPRWLWRLGELALAPAVPGLYAWSWLNSKLGGRLSP